jgi:hypothetical protein
MRSRLKHILTFGLAAIFLVSVVFCCCFIKPAQAAEKNVPACHKSASAKETKTSHDPKDCECCKTRIQAERALLQGIDLKPVSFTLFSVDIFALPQLVYHNNLAFDYGNSLPSAAFDTPLYISFHNFRI